MYVCRQDLCHLSSGNIPQTLLTVVWRAAAESLTGFLPASLLSPFFFFFILMSILNLTERNNSYDVRTEAEKPAVQHPVCPCLRPFNAPQLPVSALREASRISSSACLPHGFKTLVHFHQQGVFLYSRLHRQTLCGLKMLARSTQRSSR